MSVWTVILIIAVIAAIILGVLYFVGRKMQAKQEDQRAQLDQMAQTVNMLVIDKKRMKIMEAGFPKMVTDNIPKRAKMSKVPVVKAKIGPKITPLLCDEAIFDDVPVKAEIKAVAAAGHIGGLDDVHAYAAFGVFLVVPDELFGGLAVDGRMVGSYCGHDDAVFQRHPVDPNGGEKNGTGHTAVLSIAGPATSL